MAEEQSTQPRRPRKKTGPTAEVFTGRIVGKLTVGDRVERPPHLVGNGPWWACKCECGGSRIVNSEYLKRRPRPNCGCLHKARTPCAPKGWRVYLFRCGEFHKIGRSSNAEARRYKLDDGPIPVEYVHSFPCKFSRQVEAALHRHFHACRVRREWFRLAEEDVRRLCDVKACQGLNDLPEWMTYAVEPGVEAFAWTAVHRLQEDNGCELWLCRCRCGAEKVYDWRRVRQGLARSCGCVGRKEQSAKTTRHGLGKSAEYSAWKNMLSRCNDPSHGKYAYYGGRGIKVCERWRDLETFVQDVGRRPSLRHVLDRLEKNGNFEPGNVQWATKKEQGRNTGRNHLLTLRGETRGIAGWAEYLGISRDVIKARVNRLGWTVEAALTTPVQANSAR